MKPPDEPVDILMLNGALLSADAPALPADMPAVLRGEGIFETFLVSDGVPTPFLEYHAERLCYSASKMQFSISPETLFCEWEQLRPNLPAGRFRVRLTLLRAENDELWRMWTSAPAVLPPSEVVICLSKFRRDPSNPLAGVKHISRASSQLARRDAGEKGAYEALFATIDGDWAEGTVSNLLIFQENVLRTPSLDRGILAGVTRRVVLERAKLEGFTVEEGNVSTSDLLSADEIFITSAIMGVIPVCKIVDMPKAYPGSSGEFSKVLSQLYRKDWPFSF